MALVITKMFRDNKLYFGRLVDDIRREISIYYLLNSKNISLLGYPDLKNYLEAYLYDNEKMWKTAFLGYLSSNEMIYKNKEDTQKLLRQYEQYSSFHIERYANGSADGSYDLNFDIMLKNSLTLNKIHKALDDDLEIDQKLWKSVVYVNQVHSNPLYKAWTKNRMDIVKILLDKDANGTLIYKDKKITFPENYEYLQILIKNGMNVNNCFKNKKNLLMCAIEYDNEQLFDYLLTTNDKTKININYKVEFDTTYKVNYDTYYKAPQNENILFLAISKNNTKYFDKLIEKGASIFEKNDNNENLLMRSVKNQNTDYYFNYLLNKINIREVDNDGNNILLYATLYGNVNQLKKLLDLGLDINVLHKKNYNLLMACFDHQSLKIKDITQNITDNISFLINQGININYINKERQSVLYCAIKYGYSNILFQNYPIYNDDEDICNDNNKNNNGDKKVELIHDKNKKNQNVLMQLCNDFVEIGYKDEENIRKLIMKYGVETVDDNGIPLFFHAVKSDNLVVAKILLDYGFDINYTDKNSNNALIYLFDSISYKSHDYIFGRIVEFLIRNGIDKNYINNKNHNALYYSLCHGLSYQYLLKANIDPHNIINDYPGYGSIRARRRIRKYVYKYKN